MEKLKLYSTDCPHCNILKRMLDMDGVDYDIVDDLDSILKIARENNIKEMPILETPDGFFGFSKAIGWLKEQ